MSLRESESTGSTQNYTIISRWMHKTLNDWRITLENYGTDVLMFEEYIDGTTNKDYFDKFIQLLAQYCPNLNHVRFLFSGEKGDIIEGGLVKSVSRLPNVQCLSLFDAPSSALHDLKECDKLTTLKFGDIDENTVTINDLTDIFGSMKKLHSLAFLYEPKNQFVAALTNLTQLKALTLLYLTTSEFLQLKNCTQLEVLHIYNVYEGISTDEFLDIFKSKRNLHTLSMVFLENNQSLRGQLFKLSSYCPKLTYLTLNCCPDDFGDFVNLKYLKFDMEDAYFPPIDMEELLGLLCPKYADRLQILDISTSQHHTHSMEIARLTSLKAFLCATWPSNMYKHLLELPELQLFSMGVYTDNLNEVTNIIENCSNLRYLRLALQTESVDEFILALPAVLHRRNIQADNPFVLSLVGVEAVKAVEEKLKSHPHGELLQLDWSGNVFTSKLKDLICELNGSTPVKTIFQNPCKMAGDRLEIEDHWLMNNNYKISLKSCSNKYNLQYDEELINRCRHLTINKAEYKLANMRHAFNFKYEALDKDNDL